MLSMLISLGIFPLSLIYCFAHKYIDGDEFDAEFFGKRQTTVVKGMMILIVFFHHFSQACENVYLIEHVYRVAPISVAFFFFVSGYTTFLGHTKMGKLDFKRIWINRAWRLYLPITIFLIPFDNFLTPLLVFFIASDLAFVMFKSDLKKLAFVSVCNVLYIFVAIVIGMGEWWYDDVLTFALGFAMAIYKDKVIAFFKNKTKYVLFMITLICICIPCVYMGVNYIMYTMVTMFFSTLGCIIVVLAMMKLNVKSRFFYFIGQYTWEIYLLHQLFFELLKRVFHKNSLIMIGSFLLSIVIGVGVHKMAMQWKKKLN